MTLFAYRKSCRFLSMAKLSVKFQMQISTGGQSWNIWSAKPSNMFANFSVGRAKKGEKENLF